MAFPNLLVFGLNVSLIIFIPFFFRLNKLRPSFSLARPVQWVAALFGAGALISVATVPSFSTNALDNALAVLPNYLYWSLLVIFLVSQRKFLNRMVIYKAAFYGLLFSIVYYYFQNYFRTLPIFKELPSNVLSFLFICFTPLAIYYISFVKGKKYGWLVLIVVLAVAMTEGRRAGTVLTFLGSFPVLILKEAKLKNILLSILTIIVALFMLNIPTAQKIIEQINPRVYGLLYNPEDVRTKDQSFLIRVAQVEKGMNIFKEYPWTGIGLNNFGNYEKGIEGNFSGYKHIRYERGLNKKSSHNSYISLLAEGGLLLLFPYLILVTWCILYFLLHFFKMPPYQRPVFYALITMSIHLYFITAIVNVFAWFLIGLACMYSAGGKT